MLRGLERSHFTAGCQILIWASPDGDMIERLRLDTVPFPQQKIICFNYSYSCGGAFQELSKRIQASNHDWLPPLFLCWNPTSPRRLLGFGKLPFLMRQPSGGTNECSRISPQTQHGFS